MTFAPRTWLSLALATLLAFTSVQVAAARGPAPAVGSMVICVGQTVVTVSVDAEGQPTQGTVHLCPDVALSLFVGEGGGFVPADPQPLWLRQPRDLSTQLGLSRDAPASQARGPPSTL